MAGPSAIFLALDLVRSPILASVMREHALPGDVLALIRIAAGSDEALRDASEATGKDPSLLRKAAVFYIQQVLWARNGDCYRALGVSAEADQKEMAEHLRWFMKWLHPDRRAGALNDLYAQRVLKAWDQVKTPQRRESYDQTLRAANRAPQLRQRRRREPTSLPLIPWVGPSKSQPLFRSSYGGWLMAFIAVAATAAVVVLWARPPM